MIPYNIIIRPWNYKSLNVKYMDTFPSHLYVVSKLLWLLYHYVLPSLDLRGSHPFQHESAPVHKVKSIKMWFADAAMEELE